MLFLELENGVKAEKSVKGVTSVQPCTGVAFSRKTESTGRDESKPGAVQPSLDATRSAYEQGGTPGDKTGPVLCWVKLISLKRLYLGRCLPVTHLLSICFF